METYELQAFLVLAEFLHFTQAANQIHVSPSALSRIIQRLEDELGAKLFIRDNRKTLLTPEGKALVPRARSIVDQWNQAKIDLHPDSQRIHGEFRIFATVTACYTLLPRLLDPFRLKHPWVDVKVITGDSAGGLDLVLGGEVDVAILPMTSVPVPRVRFTPLGTTPLICIANQSYPMQPDWTRTHVILPESGIIRTMIDQWFAKRFIFPKIHAQVRGNEGILALARLGFGVGFVPELVVQNSPFAEGLQFLDPLEGMPEIALGLGYLESKVGNAAIRAFLQPTETQGTGSLVQ